MKPGAIPIGLVCLSVLLAAGSSSALGLGDLKKKAEKKAKEEANKTSGKTPAPTPPETSPAPGDAPAGAPSGGDGGKVSAVSTKFDFVPGDKILLMDDFTRDDLGEFPSRWRLFQGNFDIVDFEGGRWLRLNGDDGLIAIKSDGLPAKWTLEFDMYQPTTSGPVVTINGLAKDSPAAVWNSELGQGGGTTVTFQGPGSQSSAEVPGPNVLNGRRHISVMGNGSSLKVYVDRERMVNVPEMVYNGTYTPEALGLRMRRYSKTDPMVTNVRFAEGGKSKVDLMATPFVTHGIVFDSGSDKIRPESAPVLRQVATYLKENPEVKVTITGHTDDVGEVAANQTLSEKRAAAVAHSLTADFAIDAARLTAAGKGESAPVAPNDSPEGKATNRRVEFAKS